MTGLSAKPIREAIKILITDGWIEQTGYKKTGYFYELLDRTVVLSTTDKKPTRGVSPLYSNTTRGVSPLDNSETKGCSPIEQGDLIPIQNKKEKEFKEKIGENGASPPSIPKKDGGDAIQNGKIDFSEETPKEREQRIANKKKLLEKQAKQLKAQEG